jgi:Uncharacterized protein conserved in bacteria
MNFNRVATFPVCSQIDGNCNDDTETVAEILSASEDGMTIVYTDSPRGVIGFIDIADPSNPLPKGVVDVGGEPTSVTVWGDYAVAAVNTSEDYINTSGVLHAIDIATQQIMKSWDLGGQPDAVAASPDGKYIVIAVENERDEDLGEGIPPQVSNLLICFATLTESMIIIMMIFFLRINQMPAGYVVIVDTATSLDDWVPSVVDVTGLDGLKFPEDPEPEFVSINDDNIAVVTMQENNGIVLIDCQSKSVLSSFSAGEVDLVNIDTEEEDIINQSSSLENVPREPDGVVWLNNDYFATADEGDMDGGSRGFTIFNTDGEVIFSSGSDIDQITASIGHYPESRSGNKGAEPENVAFGTFEGTDYLFVNSERSSVVLVYDVSNPLKPKFKQVLPTNVGPEGSNVIPSRNLLVVACEEDNRDDKIRAGVVIYEYTKSEAQYPTLMSKRDKETGVAIPWGALSGLSNDPSDSDILYSIEDSYYKSSRFFTIDIDEKPAIIKKATRLLDTKGLLAASNADMVNEDGTVNIDQEGIAYDGEGMFYIASEGAGTYDDPNRPITSLNYIFAVDEDGNIHDVITLPENLNAIQSRYGLEGVAYHPEGYLIACLQRAWGDMEGPAILVYDIEAGEWVGHVVYPLEEPQSQNGGWVGLSDISWAGDNEFLVLERDNMGGPDAVIKRIYSIKLSLDELDGQVIQKEIFMDLINVYASNGSLPLEKIEGMAITEKGDVWIVNDNDGIDDNSGETQLLKVGEL